MIDVSVPQPRLVVELERDVGRCRGRSAPGLLTRIGLVTSFTFGGDVESTEGFACVVARDDVVVARRLEAIAGQPQVAEIARRVPQQAHAARVVLVRVGLLAQVGVLGDSRRCCSS